MAKIDEQPPEFYEDDLELEDDELSDLKEVGVDTEEVELEAPEELALESDQEPETETGEAPSKEENKENEIELEAPTVDDNEQLAGDEAGTTEQVATVPASATQPPQEEQNVSDSEVQPGRGLDVGTANLVGAQMDDTGEIKITPVRNAFIDIAEDPFTKKMLAQQDIPYIKRGKKLFVVGEAAFELANVFNREMRRPMKDGMISPSDAEAMPMEVELVRQVLGEPMVPNEKVYYSVPADPVDSTLNIVYHENIFSGLLAKLGFSAKSLNEGHAVVFSELGEDDFTGIGISYGGGMVNICVAFKSVPVISFAMSKGGDWIDQQSAQVMGRAASQMTAIKERGINIDKPNSPEEEAIVIYYRHLINYSLTKIIEKFTTLTDVPNFPNEISIVVTGGTSKVGGFIEVFKSEFEKIREDFPIQVGNIWRAEDALNSTARGCLIASLLDDDEDED